MLNYRSRSQGKFIDIVVTENSCIIQPALHLQLGVRIKLKFMQKEILDWAMENDISPEQYFDWEIEELYERACKRMTMEEDGEARGDYERGN